MAGMGEPLNPEQIARTAGFPTVTPVTGTPMPRPVIPTAQQAITNTVMRPVANAVESGVQAVQQAQVPDWIRQLASALVPPANAATAPPPLVPGIVAQRTGMPPGYMPVSQRPVGALAP